MWQAWSAMHCLSAALCGFYTELLCAAVVTAGRKPWAALWTLAMLLLPCVLWRPLRRRLAGRWRSREPPASATPATTPATMPAATLATMSATTPARQRKRAVANAPSSRWRFRLVLGAFLPRGCAQSYSRAHTVHALPTEFVRSSH